MFWILSSAIFNSFSNLLYLDNSQAEISACKPNVTRIFLPPCKQPLKITVFAHSQTTNKLVNEAANDSTRVSGQDRKIPPTLGTNQIAGFEGFRPLASLEKIKCDIFILLLYFDCFVGLAKI